MFGSPDKNGLEGCFSYFKAEHVLWAVSKKRVETVLLRAQSTGLFKLTEGKNYHTPIFNSISAVTYRGVGDIHFWNSLPIGRLLFLI